MCVECVNLSQGAPGKESVIITRNQERIQGFVIQTWGDNSHLVSASLNTTYGLDKKDNQQTDWTDLNNLKDSLHDRICTFDCT